MGGISRGARGIIGVCVGSVVVHVGSVDVHMGSVAVCVGSVAVCMGLAARGMWDLSLPPGVKPMSPALEDGFLTTEPPGKSWLHF